MLCIYPPTSIGKKHSIVSHLHYQASLEGLKCYVLQIRDVHVEVLLYLVVEEIKIL